MIKGLNKEQTTWVVKYNEINERITMDLPHYKVYKSLCTLIKSACGLSTWIEVNAIIDAEMMKILPDLDALPTLEDR